MNLKLFYLLKQLKQKKKNSQQNISKMDAVEESIKTMKLYHHVERVYNELKEQNISENDQIDPELLSNFDSLHYLGNQAIQNAIEKGNIQSGDKILDVGSGLGGPARMMSVLSGCSVDALELQADLHQTAANLTKRCDLDAKVKHFEGNFLNFDIKDEEYNGIVSWLVFLHIPERKQVFERCFKCLKPGGFIYIEDFYMRNQFSSEEQVMLERDIYIKFLPSIDEYKQQIQDAGFVDVQLVDMTQNWAAFVKSRFETFESNLDRNVRVHGQDAVDALKHFYNSTNLLFSGGNLGGTIILARKPNVE
eukprot:TRINITY_DN8192_c0_g1_i1.p1 TRINITY_DN8192_c0_g1~~TRINITY_DN8192_c0_g1_i1.p1  ORF type:complete len:306 (+),score=55.08 TRINITY_DN8192_c0_g1_i1:3-920(+)